MFIKKEFEQTSIKKIVVLGIDQLGGLMMSTPFFRELRIAYPDAYIVNLVGPLTYPIMQNCPYIDEVWRFDKKQSFKFVKQFRTFGFDLAFLLAGTMRAALIAFLGRVPHRIGFDADGTGRLLTIELRLSFSSRYRPENVFDFLRAVGVTPQGVYQREIWLSDANRDYALDWFKNYSQQKLLAFNPFSTDPKRRWTDSGWQTLLDSLIPLNIRPIMLVAPNEVELAKDLLNSWHHQTNITVESHSVTNTAAILEYFDYVVGPESGFAHVALAVNKPHVIALFNVLPPKSTFPPDERHIGLIEDTLPCCPCYLYKFKDICPNGLVCMKQLGAERVISTILQFEGVKNGATVGVTPL